MTRDVVRVHPQDSLLHAAKLMYGYDCGSLPVVDRNNRLIGMITDRDITVRGVAKHWDAGSMPVGAVMTDETFACHMDDTVQNCMQAMADHQVRRIPVVDDRDRVVGIISQADLARHAGGRNAEIGRRAVAEVVREVSEPSTGSYRN
jgi:CBS domain-containing protein